MGCCYCHSCASWVSTPSIDGGKGWQSAEGLAVQYVGHDRPNVQFAQIFCSLRTARDGAYIFSFRNPFLSDARAQVTTTNDKMRHLKFHNLDSCSVLNQFNRSNRNRLVAKTFDKCEKFLLRLFKIKVRDNHSFATKETIWRPYPERQWQQYGFLRSIR